MKRLLLVCAFVVTFSACHRPTPAEYLHAAKEGFAVGCSSEWVDANTCKFVNDSLDIAIKMAEKTDGTVIPMEVRQVIADLDALLPQDSRAHAYIDWLLPFLAS